MVRPEPMVFYASEGDRSWISLSVEMEGFLPAKVRVELSDAGPIFREVYLESTRSLLLVCMDAVTKEKIPDVSVVFLWKGKDGSGSFMSPRPIVSGPAGDLSIGIGQGCGSIEVVACHPGHAIKGFAIDDVETIGDGGRIVIPLEEGLEVEGIVLDDDGDPVPWVNIDLDRIDGPDFIRWMRPASLQFFDKVPDLGKTGIDGSFRIEGVPRGKYRVSLFQKDYYPDPRNEPMIVAGDGPASWAGMMRKGAALSGVVIAEDGSPVPGAQGILALHDGKGRPVKGFSKVFESDESGSFEVRGLAAGLLYDAIFDSRDGRRFLGTVDPSNPPAAWRVVLGDR